MPCGQQQGVAGGQGSGRGASDARFMPSTSMVRRIWLGTVLGCLSLCGGGCGGRSLSSPSSPKPVVTLRRVSFPDTTSSWVVSGAGTFTAKEGLKSVGFSWNAEAKEWQRPQNGRETKSDVAALRGSVSRACAKHGVKLVSSQRSSGDGSSPRGSAKKAQRKRMRAEDMVRDEEWMSIVSQDLGPGESMKVVATAGSGKTTVLKEYAQRRPHLRFLYVTYNKDMKEEKLQEFREEQITNVQVRTMHSVAYAETCHLWKKPPISSLHACVLKEDVGGDYELRSNVIETISNFLASDDQFIGREHVDLSNSPGSGGSPRSKRASVGGGGRDRDLAALSQPTEGNEDELSQRCERVMSIAQRLWGEMASRVDERRMTHDGYLKYFQLDKDSQARAFSKYDVLMLDEAHDCSAAQLDIIMSQAHSKLIVFDPHQCIYGYRGALAVNLLDSMPTTYVRHIRSTFRYGAPLSSLAAQVIKFYKHSNFSDFKIKPLPEKKTLVNSTSESRAVYEEVCGKGGRQLVVLARTNKKLFEEVSTAIATPGVKRIHFLGGIEDACGGLQKILDLFKLQRSGRGKEKAKGRIVDKYLKAFVGKGGYDAYTTMIDLQKDQRAQMTVSIVNQFQDQIPDLIKAIQSRFVADPSKADVIFTTTHKSKGLGWPDVYLSCDFVGKGRSSKDYLTSRRCVALGMAKQGAGFAWDEVKRPSGGPLTFEEWSELRGNVDMEEVNLLYVAMTRAKENLWVHEQTWDYIIGPLTSSVASQPAPSAAAPDADGAENAGAPPVTRPSMPHIDTPPPLKRSVHAS